MQRRVPLLCEETYHVFNRGAHKQQIFLDETDYRRFQVLLFLANHSSPVDVGNILSKYQGPSLVKLFEQERPDKNLVDILAYTLMPNHFHLVLKQKSTDGISLFMRKVGTAYSMYFNLKHDHSGTMFQGRFKSNHLGTDPYFQWIFSYVHLNSIAICEPEWEEKKIADLERTKNFLNAYRYSSYFDFSVAERPERNLLAHADALRYLDAKADIETLLRDCARGRVLYDVTD